MASCGLVVRHALVLATAGSTDPRALSPFSIVAITLISVALVAAFVRARRATRVDPIVALRTE